MKVTKVINHEGRQYEFAAVENGEGVKNIRESLDWERSDSLIFRKDDGEEMSDWSHWFDGADISNVIAVIEHHIGGVL